MNAGRSRLAFLGLLLSLALIVGQASIVAANADTSRDRSSGTVSTTKVVSKSGKAAASTKSGGTSKVAAPSAAQVALTVNLDQWANKPGKGWQNGDLNKNNSAYHEGEVVPFRLAIEGLSAGSHSIHINYDFTAGGREAYDFLATWNDTESPGLCDTGGGAVSSMCAGGLPAPDTHQFPSDSYTPGSPTDPGLPVSGAETGSRDLTMYGGTITNITGPTHDGSDSGNGSGDFVVTFTTTGDAALFVWGGHLASSLYWTANGGAPNGASQVSGAPWHMRTQQLDNAGNKNQDRSIQPGAIVPISALSVTKTADNATVQAGGQIGFTITVSNDGNQPLDVTLTDTLPTGPGVSWTVADDGGASCSIAVNGVDLTCTYAGLAAGAHFTVHLTSLTTNDSCGLYDNTATASSGDITGESSDSVTVEGCLAAPQLIVIKHVINDNGGSAVAGDFTMGVNATNPSKGSFPGEESPGTTITLDPGSYSVDEIGPSGYAASFSQDCSGTIALGETKTCTVTNDDNPVLVPNVTIEKDGTPTVGQGGAVQYTLTVTNTGNGTASSVTVSDDLYDGYTNVQATASQGSCNVGVGNLVTCSLGDLAPSGQPGDSATVTITATAPNDNTCPTIPNTASVDGENFQASTSNQITTTVTGCSTPPPPPPPPPPGSPALTITKTADAQTVLAGAPIGFTVTVSSTGSATATGVTLSDPLPSGSGISWSIAGGSGAAQCSISGSTLSCNFGDMAPGSSRSVHVTSPTTTDSCGAYDNTATASGTNVGSVQASASTAVDCPAIQVVKSAHPDHGAPGETITYKYVVTNIGTVDLFDISVDDDVLGHICDIPLLHPGESQTCTKDYVIPQDANISIKNVVIAKGHDAEGNEVQDDDTVTIDVILGATVTPKPTKTPPAGVAFTGSSAAIPLGGIALLLLMVGTALMWLGRRGRRPTAG